MRGFARKGEIDGEPLSLQDSETERKTPLVAEGKLVRRENFFFFPGTNFWKDFNRRGNPREPSVLSLQQGFSGEGFQNGA